jgi:hypothetical protein
MQRKRKKNGGNAEKYKENGRRYTRTMFDQYIFDPSGPRQVGASGEVMFLSLYTHDL